MLNKKVRPAWVDQDPSGHLRGWRAKAHEIIFEADTPAGKAFDIALIFTIILSVIAVMLESVAPVRARYGSVLRDTEWVITILFTIEYIARLATVDSKIRYARSFYGIVDLMAILPVYLSVILPGAQSLLVIRSLRLLRVFRVFKMAHWLSEANYLIRAIRASSRKIVVFLVVVVLITAVTMLRSALQPLPARQ